MTSPHDWQTCFTCTGLPPIQKTILRPPHDDPGAEEDFRRPPEAETARHDRAGCEGVACGRTGRSLEGLLNFRWTSGRIVAVSGPLRAQYSFADRGRRRDAALRCRR